jgi:hypothetical protein
MIVRTCAPGMAIGGATIASPCFFARRHVLVFLLKFRCVPAARTAASCSSRIIVFARCAHCIRTALHPRHLLVLALRLWASLHLPALRCLISPWPRPSAPLARARVPMAASTCCSWASSTPLRPWSRPFRCPLAPVLSMPSSTRSCPSEMAVLCCTWASPLPSSWLAASLQA